MFPSKLLSSNFSIISELCKKKPLRLLVYAHFIKYLISIASKKEINKIESGYTLAVFNQWKFGLVIEKIKIIIMKTFIFTVNQIQ